MRARFLTHLTSLALMLVTAGVVVQLPAQQKGRQPDKTYTSAKEVMAMIAKAKSDRKQDQPTFVQESAAAGAL